jgi:hypothetical protein
MSTKIIKGIMILIAISMVCMSVGCSIKAMTPAQKEQQVQILANDIGLIIFMKRPEMIEKADKYADMILTAQTSTEVGNLYNMAFRYYLDAHPEDIIFISMGRQLIGLMGVEFSGIDVVPSSVDLNLAKIAADGFKNGLQGKIAF